VRGGAAWQLGCLISIRSLVQIQPPQPSFRSCGHRMGLDESPPFGVFHQEFEQDNSAWAQLSRRLDAGMEQK
jgi:hypothetical protein